jgi:hypothetical protein
MRLLDEYGCHGLGNGRLGLMEPGVGLSGKGGLGPETVSRGLRRELARQAIIVR